MMLIWSRLNYGHLRGSKKRSGWTELVVSRISHYRMGLNSRVHELMMGGCERKCRRVERRRATGGSVRVTTPVFDAHERARLGVTNARHRGNKSQLAVIPPTVPGGIIGCLSCLSSAMLIRPCSMHDGN